jgi:hypothetical protein
MDPVYEEEDEWNKAAEYKPERYPRKPPGLDPRNVELDMKFGGYRQNQEW